MDFETGWMKLLQKGWSERRPKSIFLGIQIKKWVDSKVFTIPKFLWNFMVFIFSPLILKTNIMPSWRSFSNDDLINTCSFYKAFEKRIKLINKKCNFDVEKEWKKAVDGKI